MLEEALLCGHNGRISKSQLNRMYYYQGNSMFSPWAHCLSRHRFLTLITDPCMRVPFIKRLMANILYIYIREHYVAVNTSKIMDFAGKWAEQ